MPGRVVVVGLGPAGADLLLPAARDALARVPVCLVRTAHHPAVDDLASAGIAMHALDPHYDDASDLDAAYGAIADAVLEAADAEGEVVYAVPGNPAVAERTVELLHAAARAGAVELEVVPGLSFADLAWARLRIDPMALGATVVDGRTLRGPLSGPILVAQCDTRVLLSEVKVTLLEALGPDARVTILQHLGLPDERVVDLTLAELDRAVEPDHLTSVWVPGPTAGATVELARLLELAALLRGPGGCPWDADQTHDSLTRYLLEEAYEVVDAIERLPDASDDLCDELGDLLYQVVFHAVIAHEEGWFGMAEVARGIHDKLVRRHPHVFGDVDATTSADVMRSWEQIKREERGDTSIVGSVPRGLPSLLYTHKLLRKASTVGIEIDPAEARERVAAALDEPDAEAAIAELLAAAVVLARAGEIDAESALRGWAARFRRRFEVLEARAAAEGLDLATADPATVRAIWSQTLAPGST